jgi:hypothetical protein
LRFAAGLTGIARFLKKAKASVTSLSSLSSFLQAVRRARLVNCGYRILVELQIQQVACFQYGKLVQLLPHPQIESISYRQIGPWPVTNRDSDTAAV